MSAIDYIFMGIYGFQFAKGAKGGLLDIDLPSSNKAPEVEIAGTGVTVKADSFDDVLNGNDYIDSNLYLLKNKYTQSSSSEISQLLYSRPELTGTNRERLLSGIQDSKLYNLVDQLYRPGAKIGDGGAADILISEFCQGKSNHLIKAKGRLTQVNRIIESGSLGLNDLDIAEALKIDLENAIKLFD